MLPGLVSQVADCRLRRSNRIFLHASGSACGVPDSSLSNCHTNCSSGFRRRASRSSLTSAPGVKGEKEKLAGWVARTRPPAEPLSPRGPQPVPRRLQTGPAPLNGPPEPANGVRESWYALFCARGRAVVANRRMLYKVIIFNTLQETPSRYLRLLGGVRTTSSISALEFMELGSFTHANQPVVASLNSSTTLLWKSRV